MSLPSSSENHIVYYDGSAWQKFTDVEVGSAVLDMEDGIVYVRGSGSGNPWVQVSMPTSWAFGNGLVSNAGVVDINIVTNGGLEFTNDALEIADNRVTRDHLADFAGAGALIVGGSSGAVLDLAMGASNTVLTAGSGGLAYGLLGDANVDANAAIAITKLAAKSISGKDLGTNLDSLSAASNQGLELSASYNGSAGVTIGLDFKRHGAFIPDSSGLGSAVGLIREAILQDEGGDCDEALLAGSHCMALDVLLFRNGIRHQGRYIQGSRLGSSNQVGDFHLFVDSGKLKLEIFEGAGTSADDYDGDGFSVGFMAQA
jgi:hypothetical protein